MVFVQCLEYTYRETLGLGATREILDGYWVKYVNIYNPL